MRDESIWHLAGAPIPAALLRSSLAAYMHASPLTLASDTTTALFDLLMFSAYPLERLEAITGQTLDATSPVTTQILNTLSASLGPFPQVPGTAWHAAFQHAFGYGASYYAYTYA